MNEQVLASELARHLSAPNGAEGFAPILIALLKELSKGQAVAVCTLAERTGQATGRVSMLLRNTEDVEWDDNGNVVGYGLTLSETPHQFEVEGRKLYTWCAFDTLFFPALIEKPVRVHSICPVTRTSISLEVSPNRLTVVEPLAAVIAMVVPASGAPIRTTFCCNVHFFASHEVGTEWARGRPDVEIMAVDRGFQLGKALAAALLTHAD